MSKGTRMNEITDIKLVSHPEAARIELQNEIMNSLHLRGAIAFFTTPPPKSPNFHNLLQHPGFLVCDLHPPTNIDYLNTLSSNGCDIFLDWERYSGPKIRSESRGLMHAKVLLFDRADESARIWVGSHNWTGRALTGLNVEASIVISTHQGSSIYSRIEDFLEHTKKRATAFNPHRVSFYKQLQRGITAGGSSTIEIEGPKADSLNGKRLLILVDDPKTIDISKLNNGSRHIIEITDSDTSKVFLYESVVYQLGYFKDPGSNTFLGNRYAHRKGLHLPFLMTKTSPPQKIIDKSHSFVRIEITNSLPPGSQALPLPEDNDLWETSESNYDIRKKFLADDWKLLGTSPRRKKPLIERPNLDYAHPGRDMPHQTVEDKRKRSYPTMPVKKFIDRADDPFRDQNTGT
jgi:hypothetical protein